METTTERFWSKVEKSDGCWLWTAALYRSGYGHFSLRKGKGVAAHRLSYELENGEIPAGLCVLHRCDEKRCVRPDHLFLGTRKDNADDRDRKGRGVSPPPQRGALNRHAKLNPNRVREIRFQYGLGGVRQRDLAFAYGVTQSVISKIVRGVAWTEVL